MTENMQEADPEYAGVAEEHEDVRVVSFLEAFTTFHCPIPAKEPRCITTTFQQLLCLFVH